METFKDISCREEWIKIKNNLLMISVRIFQNIQSAKNKTAVLKDFTWEIVSLPIFGPKHLPILTRYYITPKAIAY